MRDNAKNLAGISYDFAHSFLLGGRPEPSTMMAL